MAAMTFRYGKNTIGRTKLERNGGKMPYYEIEVRRGEDEIWIIIPEGFHLVEIEPDKDFPRVKELPPEYHNKGVEMDFEVKEER